ncbi:MAG: hypothetical protein AB1716_13465 [Planctomycetota bacterium]
MAFPEYPLIVSCVIARNVGGGSYSGELRNCTVVGNFDYGPGSGACEAWVTNSILWGNQPGQVYGGRVTYSDIEGGWTGSGNINADPLFADPNAGDYHQRPGSPCVDRGDPNYQPLPGELDCDGQMRRWDGDGNGVAVVDMGADEFGSFAYGDLNCDGAVSFGDINPFVLALSDPSGYARAYPACRLELADLNADGRVGFEDINPFVALLSGR